MLSITPTFAAFSNGVVGRSAVAQRSGAMTMGVESLVGASEEISGKVWDPLNLSANMDEGNLNLVRAAELKHCRVAMLATVGWCWTATGTHFEGMLSTSAGISFASLAQLDPLTAASKVPAAGIWQMIVAIGCLEVTALGRPNPPVSRTPNPPGAPPLAPSPDAARAVATSTSTLRLGPCAMSARSNPIPGPNPAPDPDQVYWENKFPAYKCGGNYGVPACTQDPAKFRELQLAELKNGRLAMIGIISFATAEALPGSVPFYPF